jgi:hypothetical protein
MYLALQCIGTDSSEASVSLHCICLGRVAGHLSQRLGSKFPGPERLLILKLMFNEHGRRYGRTKLLSTKIRSCLTNVSQASSSHPPSSSTSRPLRVFVRQNRTPHMESRV